MTILTVIVITSAKLIIHPGSGIKKATKNDNIAKNQTTPFADCLTLAKKFVSFMRFTPIFSFFLS